MNLKLQSIVITFLCLHKIVPSGVKRTIIIMVSSLFKKQSKSFTLNFFIKVYFISTEFFIVVSEIMQTTKNWQILAPAHLSSFIVGTLIYQTEQRIYKISPKYLHDVVIFILSNKTKIDTSNFAMWHASYTHINAFIQCA